FESPAEEAHFRADTSGRKFWDPTAKSCTRFLARVCADRFDWDLSPLAELIDWAEVIDGAQFPDARTAVELTEPAMQFMLLVAVTRGPNRSKISLGSNPWKQELRRHNLARIAERYGGGGHPAVAAISFKPEQLDEARSAARTIAAELRAFVDPA